MRSVQDLLDEFRATGQQAPFEELVRRFAGMVFHVCLQVTKNSHDAEDATQAVFLTLAIQAKTGKPIKALGPWLQQVAYRLSLDMRKSKRRRMIREEKHAECVERFAPDGSVGVSMHELRQLLVDELNKLPAKYRLPLILHYFGGLSREEMARELNCKVSTLGVRLHRGREMLGNRLGRRGIALAGGLLAVVMAKAVHSAISESIVVNTCEAATALAAGRTIGPGIISAHVLSVVRGAAHAVLLARAKVAAIVLAMAGTAVATGAQVVSRFRPPDLKLRIPKLEQVLPSRPFQVPLRPFSANTATENRAAAGTNNPLAFRVPGDGVPVWTYSHIGGQPMRLVPNGPTFSMVFNNPPGSRTAETAVWSLPHQSDYAPAIAQAPIIPGPVRSAAMPDCQRFQRPNANAGLAMRAGPVRGGGNVPRVDPTVVPDPAPAVANQGEGASRPKPPPLTPPPMDPMPVASIADRISLPAFPAMAYAPPTSSYAFPTLPANDSATTAGSTSMFSDGYAYNQIGTDATTGVPIFSRTQAGFAATLDWSLASAGSLYTYDSSSMYSGLVGHPQMSSPVARSSPSMGDVPVTPEPGAMVLVVGAALLLARRDRHSRKS